MSRFAAWIKKWWWMLLLGLAVTGTLLWLIFRKGKPSQQTESFSTKARRKVVEAETDAKIAKLKTEAESGVKRERLRQIEKIKDDEDRRTKLAAYLDDLL